jgi:hypothetical protein
VIPPGEVGKLEATIDTQKLTGPVVRGIVVNTNDPAAPKVWLTVEANVLGSVSLVPQHRIRVASRRESVGRVLVRQEPSETGELKIHDLQSPDPAIELRAQKLTEKRFAADGLPTGYVGDWLLEASLVGQTNPGRSIVEISFATDLPRQPRVTVPITVSYAPPVELSRPQVEWTGEGSIEPLLIAVRKGLDPTTLEVTSLPDGLDARLEPSGDRFYRLHLSVGDLPPKTGELVLTVGGLSYRVPVTAGRP